MKIALRIAGLLTGLAVLAALTLAGVVFATAVTPARPLGIRQEMVTDAKHPPIPVVLIYPTSSRPQLMLAGAGTIRLARGGVVAGEHLPVVVMSHGTGGSSLSHLDTALALAEAGYLVALPQHAGDNFRDDTDVGTPRWIEGRARQVIRVNDFLLREWSGRSRLDSGRLGLFGFSAGGTTGLVVLGGRPDMGRVPTHCAKTPELVCKLIKPGPAAQGWAHDPRVKAAVVAAPGFGFAFDHPGLAAVSAPVQLWIGDQDVTAPAAANADRVRDLLPTPPDYHRVPGAAHLSFLSPCGLAGLLLPPMLCADPKGFDRRAFHQTFNRQVVAFFNSRLGAAPSSASTAR
jgi:predicted dienelactone hydrolase